MKDNEDIVKIVRKFLDETARKEESFKSPRSGTSTIRIEYAVIRDKMLLRSAFDINIPTLLVSREETLKMVLREIITHLRKVATE